MQHSWYVGPDDIPYNVVVYPRVTVSQAVSCCNDSAPLNLGMRLTYIAWNMVCRLADQYKIAQSGIVDECIRTERLMIQSIRIRLYFFAGFDHILNKEPPTTLFIMDFRH